MTKVTRQKAQGAGRRAQGAGFKVEVEVEGLGFKV